MAKQLFANNAKTSMSGSLAVGGTAFVCAAGEGAKFPTPTGGDYFLMTLFELDVGGNEIKLEVVKVTARTGDSFTIVRDIENMTGNAGGYAYAGGASVCYAQMRVTAKTLTDVPQLGAANTFTDVQTITANSTSPALKVVQTGTGNAIEVQDQASDTTPFAVDQSGNAKFGASGSAAAPSVAIAGTSDTGLFGAATNVGIAAEGVQAARFFKGYSCIGENNPSPNVFFYNYGTLSQSASTTLQGLYQRVTFPVATGNGTTYVSQFHMGNTLDISDSGGAVAVTSVYGFNANAPIINSVNGSTAITNFYQFRAAGLPETKIAAAYGYFSDLDIVSGKTRWNFYGNGNAPSYDGGDRHIAGNRFDKQPSPVAVNTTGTLSTASLLGRLITSAPAAGINLTLPDGTTLDAAVTMPNTNFSFDWNVINTSGSFTATILQGSAGHIVVGNMVVAANSSATFRTRRTGVNTFITYRVS